MMPQLLFAHGTRCINLVTKDQEGNLRELLNGQQGVELSFRLRKALEIGTVDEKDDAIDLGKVIAPEAASWTDLNEPGTTLWLP